MRAFWTKFWHSCRVGQGLFIPPWESLPQGKGCARVDVLTWAVDRLVQGPLFGFYQAWMCYVWNRDEGEPRAWAYYFGHWSYLLFEKVAGWVERRSVSYRWNAPDSGDPNEIGFHSLSDGSHKRSPMRVYSYSYSGDSPITTSGDCTFSGTWTVTANDDDQWSYT